MRIILDNAQHTPHISFLDDNGKIVKQLSICEDGLLLDGKEVPKKDGIVLQDK